MRSKIKNPAKRIDWKKVDGLVPAVIQDVKNDLVLMVGYMNEEALTRTMKTGNVWFYSRTKKRLWMKGEESKNVLKVNDILLDCDSDTLLIKAQPTGPTCHTGAITCFKELPRNNPLRDMCATIQQRKMDLPKGSYTTSLFQAGTDRMALKVAEEAMEVIHAATKQTRKKLIEESTDLFYHLYVLLAAKDVTLADIESEMSRRSKRNG